MLANLTCDAGLYWQNCALTGSIPIYDCMDVPYSKIMVCRLHEHSKVT